MNSTFYYLGYVTGVLSAWRYEIAIVLLIYGLYRKRKNRKDKIANWLIVLGVVGIVFLMVDLFKLFIL